MMFLLQMAVCLNGVRGWIVQQRPPAPRRCFLHDPLSSYKLLHRVPSFASLPSSTTRSTSQLSMNVFQNIGDLLTGGKLTSQTQLPYDTPLEDRVAPAVRTLAVAERPISFTGEDFDVLDVPTRSLFCRVRGSFLHLPGKDKMNLYGAQGQVMCQLDRKLVSLTPTYDIYRGSSGEKVGWIEKAVIAFTDTFEVHLEGIGLGPFKPPAAFRLEGDFLDRNFCMKNDKGEVVAKVAKDGWIQFDSFNHYQIQVAPGMDAALVVACTCAIDEEFDEEHKEQRKRDKGE